MPEWPDYSIDSKTPTSMALRCDIQSMAQGIVDWESAGLSAQEWHSIVVGNGMSIGVSKSFEYRHLGAQTLSPRLKAVLDKCGTDNIETGLLSLEHALRVHEALMNAVADEAQSDVAQAVANLDLEGLRHEMRVALIRAVRNSHPSFQELSEQRRFRIRRVLDTYRSVFTTNYDLLTYWCLVDRVRKLPRDYFWRESSPGFRGFAPFALDAVDGKPRESGHLYYLHGALHLRECPDGEGAEKTTRAAGGGGSLLEAIRETWGRQDTEPLFVSEGSTAQKQARIARSTYLTFAAERLASSCGRTVVYGSAIQEQDAHIWSSIGEHAEAVAVAVHGDPCESASAEKDQLMRRARYLFGRDDVDFFWTSTHPLYEATRAG